MKRLIAMSAAILAAALAACQPAAPAGKPVVRVGYFPNITHSQALIGLARGDFEQALRAEMEEFCYPEKQRSIPLDCDKPLDGTIIEPTIFNAGPSEIEALFAGQIDIGYIGPNPAINGFIKSEGVALRIIAGATSGGAAFIVRPDANIHSAADLAGKTLASPQLGNTQDVALRGYLVENGLQVTEKGGTVTVVPTDNPQILDLFRLGHIDGAWVPEPWASRLIVDGGGVVFIDERDLWTGTGGEFVTANIIVSTKFLAEHPDLVKAWLRAHVEVTQWELENPAEAQELLNTEIEKITGKKLPAEVLSMAWGRMTTTWDPISASLYRSAEMAFEAGYLKDEPKLDGIYDLSLLNQVLSEMGLAAVQ